MYACPSDHFLFVALPCSHRCCNNLLEDSLVYTLSIGEWLPEMNLVRFVIASDQHRAAPPIYHGCHRGGRGDDR